MAEELAFEQFGRKSGAVHLDERPLAARRARVDGAGHQFLADAAFAPDEHGDVAVGNLIDDRGNRLHFRAVAPEQERAILVVGQLPPELGDFRHEPRLLDGVLDGAIERDLAESLRIVRLDNVVSRAESDRFDNG